MIQFITYFSFAIEILLACFYCPSYGLPFSCYALLMWVLWFFKCIFRWKDVRFWFLKLLELSLNTLQISYYSAYVIRRSVLIFKPIPKPWFPKYFSVSNILFQVFSYLNLFFFYLPYFLLISFLNFYYIYQCFGAVWFWCGSGSNLKSRKTRHIFFPHKKIFFIFDFWRF